MQKFIINFKVEYSGKCEIESNSEQEARMSFDEDSGEYIQGSELECHGTTITDIEGGK